MENLVAGQAELGNVRLAGAFFHPTSQLSTAKRG